MDRTEWNRKLAAWREKLPAPLQNRTNLILFCAVLGIVFISLSYILEREPQQGNLDSGTPQSISSAERDLEQRLTEIVSHIDGAGRTTVMVTMDSTGEVVYAKDTSCAPMPARPRRAVNCPKARAAVRIPPISSLMERMETSRWWKSRSSQRSGG